LTTEEQKAIKGGAVFCSNGPCMDSWGNFQGYCQSNWSGGCQCTFNGVYCS
jgi:hypothetical protein